MTVRSPDMGEDSARMRDRERALWLEINLYDNQHGRYVETFMTTNTAVVHAQPPNDRGPV